MRVERLKAPACPEAAPLGAGNQKVHARNLGTNLMSHSASNIAKHTKTLCKSQPGFAL